MKVEAIQVGGIYHDGKAGVREVISMDGAPGCGDTKITYRILAAKSEQKYSYAEKAMVSLIGSTSQCTLASFAVWAKIVVPACDKTILLTDLAAKKLQLAPGETRFMASVAEAFDDAFPLVAGCKVSFGFHEIRSARGIEKKGLATVALGPPCVGGEIALTELGVAWIRRYRLLTKMEA